MLPKLFRLPFALLPLAALYLAAQAPVAAVPPPVFGPSVMTPPQTPPGTAQLPRGTIPKGPPTIMDVVLGSADLTTLLTAIMATDMGVKLSAPDQMTLFAPTNAAFDKLPAAARTALMAPANKGVLTRILSNHIFKPAVSAEALAAQIKAGGGTTKLMMESGESVTAALDGQDIVITDSAGNRAHITKADNKQANGVVHMIDSLLLPQPKRSPM